MRKHITSLCISVLMGASSVIAEENIARVMFIPPTDEQSLEIKKELEESETASVAINFINENFALGSPLVFKFGTEDGPLYDPQTREIEFPYTFVEEAKFRFQQDSYGETGTSADEAALDVVLHTIFHELAHAFIDIYELPVLGKEEDAADSLATFILIEYFENGQEIAISAADLFDLESDDYDEFGDENFWAQHSLDDQRYFTTLCHVYGSAPDQYKWVVDDRLLSNDRADSCIEEYELMVQSWSTVLAPHLKN